MQPIRRHALNRNVLCRNGNSAAAAIRGFHFQTLLVMKYDESVVQKRRTLDSGQKLDGDRFSGIERNRDFGHVSAAGCCEQLCRVSSMHLNGSGCARETAAAQLCKDKRFSAPMEEAF